MNRWLALAPALGLTAGAAHAVWSGARRTTLSRKASERRRRPTPAQLEAWIRAYGASGNSFMTLYPGFEAFVSEDPTLEGAICFVETGRAWAAGAEPFCPPAHRARLLREFAEAAEALGKTALLLPAEEPHLADAQAAGYRHVMIGSEPTFDLARYPRTGHTWTDVVPTAKILAGKGAAVTEFHPAGLAPAEKAELDAITAAWLDSRKMDALGFLNQVDPWFRAADKRYFRVAQGGRTLAFLAAIPIWKREGWYLIDLLRRDDTPAGTTELLLLQAMRLLRESGAREATMGVAPLSGMEMAPRGPLVYRLLAAVYEHGNALYNFKPLHQYKMKFDPTHSVPVYLIYRPRLGVSALLGLSRAFMPTGMARSSLSGLVRMIERFSPSAWITGQLRSDVIVRSVPPSFARLLRRCKLTCALLVLHLVSYGWGSAADGTLRPGLRDAWGYSWAAFVASPARALALSPWLHENFVHFSLNWASLALFVGGLEYLAGSAVAAGAFLAGIALANPLCSLALTAAARLVPAAEADVGSSLGIFACAGVFCFFLRRGRLLFGGLAVGILVEAALRGEPMDANHLFALMVGGALARGLVR